MIIVSQDKSVIVNCENMESIEIGNVEENQGKGIIYARLVSDYFYKIGEYATEKRAEEVLREIIKCYEMTEFYKVAAGADQEYIQDNSSIFKYKMPEA